MRESEIQKIEALAKKADKYSDQFKEILNPAYIQFTKFGQLLRAIQKDTPKAVDDGKTLNISALQEQLRAVCNAGGCPLSELRVSLSKNEIDIQVTIIRKFKNSKASYKTEEKSFYALTVENCIEEVSEWIDQHSKEYEAIHKEIGDVIIEKKPPEEPTPEDENAKG